MNEEFNPYNNSDQTIPQPTAPAEFRPNHSAAHCACGPCIQRALQKLSAAGGAAVCEAAAAGATAKTARTAATKATGTAAAGTAAAAAP